MAIEESRETVPERDVVRSRRTKLVIIFSELGEVPRVEAHRERVSKVVESGEITRKVPLGTVSFLLTDVAKEFVTLDDGTTLTGIQMGEAISKWIDAKDLG